MAITGSYNYCGIDIPNSYIRAEYLSGDKYHGWIAQAVVYKDQASASNDSLAVNRIAVGAPPGIDGYTIIYDAIKALPQFDGFTDV